MRHKTFLINPEIIHNQGIEVFKCIQKPGEFVITFGGSYHAGFNMGFNCAEAVNFATKNWINLGIKSKICQCRKDSVQINMTEFIKNVNQKGLLKKKEFEEFNENIWKNFNMPKGYLNPNIDNEFINSLNLDSNNNNTCDNIDNNNRRLVEKKANSNKSSKKELINIEKNLNLKRKIKKSEKISLRKKRVRNEIIK